MPGPFRVSRTSSVQTRHITPHLCSAALLAVLAAYTQQVDGAVVDWSPTAASDAWGSNANWIGGVVPADDLVTDTARFNQTGYANQPNAGTRRVRGVQIGDGSTATAPLTISGSHLTLGVGGINMTAGAGAATIGSPLTLGTGQIWTNASSNTLAINGTMTRTTGRTISVVNSGSGSVTSSTLANDTTGIIGPWVSYGSGTATRYASVSSGTIGGYTAGTGTGSANSITSATTNYEFTGSSQTATGSMSANTIRYAGTGATITLNNAQSLTTNGILNAGTGALQLRTVSGTGNVSSLTIGDSGELVLNAANAAIHVGNTIQGTGNLVVTGAGSVSVSSNNPHPFAGKIVVNPGSTLALGFNVGFANVTSTTIDGGTITLTSNGTQTAFGNGDLIINGGTINRSLGGSAAFLNTTSTIFLNGDLAIDASVSTTFNGTVKLSAPRIVTTTNTAQTTFAGAIDDNGGGFGFTKSGSGTTLLNGANTFSGPLSVSGGTLYLGNSSSQSSTIVSVNNGATLGITHSPSGGTSETFAGLSDGATGGGTITYAGTTSGTLVLAGSGDYSFGGVITNNAGKNLSINKTGSGTQRLGGPNTYTGTTAVNGGRLLINGSLAAASAVTVANGARLGGTGTINGTVTVAGGGALDLRDATTGTLSLTNSVALASPTTASNLFFDIGTGLGSNDVVAITGTPTLGAGGAIITINALGSSLTPGHYTLMTAAGGLGTSGFSLASSSIVAGTTTYNLSLASSTSTAQILSITAVPEPTFLGMVGLSLMGMIGARRRV